MSRLPPGGAGQGWKRSISGAPQIRWSSGAGQQQGDWRGSSAPKPQWPGSSRWIGPGGREMAAVTVGGPTLGGALPSFRSLHLLLPVLSPGDSNSACHVPNRPPAPPSTSWRVITAPASQAPSGQAAHPRPETWTESLDSWLPEWTPSLQVTPHTRQPQPLASLSPLPAQPEPPHPLKLPPTCSTHLAHGRWGRSWRTP